MNTRKKIFKLGELRKSIGMKIPMKTSRTTRGTRTTKTIGALAALLACYLNFQLSQEVYAAGRLSIVPYASVSSSKSIKPTKSKDASEESVNQRTTYGLKIDVRLLSVVSLQVQGGVNQLDKTKKQSAVRDEFKEIDFEKDLNLDTGDASHQYRYQEEQRLGVAKLVLSPRLGKYLWVRAGAGVRARQRMISVTDKVKEEKTSIKDPIRYHAVGSAGIGIRLFGATSAQVEYNFYFMKFPKTQPHEQEVSVGFAVSI